MTEKDNIRVRFAPSPTGYLHLGGLRTALFNYLYARSQGGKFILRIEDTDRTRLVGNAQENLLDVFDWLGIDFDEGPHIGGDFGPYVQSERLNIYREHAEYLLKQGHAYRCFCSAKELEAKRGLKAELGENTMYDRNCRYFNSQVSNLMAESQKFVIRLKMPLEGNITFNDGIRGNVSFEASAVDDQVLVKSDGFPTYHLANVVDDHLMGISDVIRGEEWLTSTPKHVHLYHIFGWKLPRFHHLPLLLNKDRSKLSKRQGDVAVEDYRSKGYLADALINYSALLGWHPADDQDFLSRDELIEKFSLDRVGKAGAVFDVDKLNWLNRQHMGKLSEEEFLAIAADYLPGGFDFISEEGRKTLSWLREGIIKLADITERMKPFFWKWEEPLSGEVVELVKSENAKKVYQAMSELLPEADDWNSEVFKALIKQAGKAAGVKGKDLWMSMRAALTGQLHGPDLSSIAGRMDKETFGEYIGKAMEY